MNVLFPCPETRTIFTLSQLAWLVDEKTRRGLFKFLKNRRHNITVFAIIQHSGLSGAVFAQAVTV